MRKTPSYLKGLAKTRARAAGSLQRLKNLRSEVQRKLKVAKADVERYQKMEAEHARKLEEAPTDLKSCGWLPKPLMASRENQVCLGLYT